MRLDEPVWWYGENARDSRLARALSVLGLVYGWVARMRFRWTSPYRSRLPVICIGNFTAGGTGKTPLALLIAEDLRAQGFAPVCLTRGYGGSRHGPAWVTAGEDTAADVGDEPLLLARVAPTVVARDRAAGVRFIERDCKPETVIVMDDGLQNPSVAKTLSVAVVDGARGLGNGRVIPAGPLRAPLDFQLGLVDCIVVNAAGEGRLLDDLRRSFPGPVLAAEPVPGESAADLKETAVVAFAGIGHPARFFALLERIGAKVVQRHAFADHHVFTETEAERLLAAAEAHGAQLVTTEKDMARFEGGNGASAALKARARAVPVRLSFGERDHVRLKSLIDAAAAPKRRPY